MVNTAPPINKQIGGWLTITRLCQTQVDHTEKQWIMALYEMLCHTSILRVGVVKRTSCSRRYFMTSYNIQPNTALTVQYSMNQYIVQYDTESTTAPHPLGTAGCKIQCILCKSHVRNVLQAPSRDVKCNNTIYPLQIEYGNISYQHKV